MSEERLQLEPNISFHRNRTIDDDRVLCSLLVSDLDEFFPLMIDAYSNIIYRWAYRYVSAEAADITQRVLINFYFAMKKFPKERISSLELGPYLSRITRNECFKVLRERERSIPDISLDDPNETGIENLIDNTGISAEYTVERRVMLQEAFSKLSPKEQKVMYLRYVMDMAETEIATVLNEPLGTVKSRISRARSKSLKVLEGPEESKTS